MRARGVTTPLLIATASSSIDRKTVSSPGESSIRYIHDPHEGRSFRANIGVMRLGSVRKFHAMSACIFVHDGLTAAIFNGSGHSRCNGCDLHRMAAESH